MLKMMMETPDYGLDAGDSRLFRPAPNCEIINGEPAAIFYPGIRHQRVLLKLSALLFQALEKEDLGFVLNAPCNVMLSPWDVVQPDILFIRKNRIGIIGDRIILGAPDLVVEILSDETRCRDTRTKRKIYADAGVREYWIVDPDEETIEPLIWSEVGYISAGIFNKESRFSSLLLPRLDLSLPWIFEPAFSKDTSGNTIN